MDHRRSLLALALATTAVAPALAGRYIVQLQSPPEASPLQAGSRAEVQATLRRRAALAQAPLLADLGALGIAPGSGAPRSFWIANAVAVTATPEQAAALRRRPDVASVDEDVVLAPPVVTEDGAPPADDSVSTWGLKRMRVLEAQRDYGVDGTGVVVGILDTGFDATHPSLAGRLLAFRDFATQASQPVDDNGHGSHCAGTIGGGPLGSMQIGVAPGVKFVAGRIFGPDGATTEGILAAMQWVVDPDGQPGTGDEPRLVSNSWGGGPGRPVYQQAVQSWLALGIAPIFAAGNSGPRASTVGSPADYPESFAVGATTAEDAVARFSSRGPSNFGGVEAIKPDVSAPGKAVTSVKAGGGSWTISGTSMATPHVAGLAALIYQARPDLGPRQVLEAIETASVDKGEAGKDNSWGTGEVDALAALAGIFQGGVLEGQVRAATGEVIPYATLTVAGEGRGVRLDAEGRYRIFRPEGTFELTAEAFGYAPVAAQATVTARGSAALDFALAALPTGTVRGRVHAGEVPLEATVLVVGTPLEAVETGADGAYQRDLPAGSYQLAASAYGFEPGVSEPVAVAVGEVAELDLELAALPPVLVVADDAGAGYGALVHDALPVPGKLVARGDLAALDGRLLSQYQAVVWLSGDERRDVLGEDDQAALAAYVDGGGRLLLTGQDLATSMRMTRFARAVCKLEVVADTDRSFEVEGLGVRASLRGGDGARNQRSPDALAARAGGSELMAYASGKAAGVLARHGKGRVAVLGFGVEGVSGASTRAKLVRAVLGALGLRLGD